MKRIIISGIIIVLIIAAINLIFYKVDESSNVLVTQFGDPISTQEEAGLQVKLPWQTIHRIEKRLQFYETPLITYVTGDRQLVVLQVYLLWQIENPLKYFKSVRTVDKATQKLDDIVTAAVGSKIGTVEFSNLVSTQENKVKIPEIEKVIGDQVNKVTIKDYGVSVKRFGISRFALPEENVVSVYQKIKAERSAIANEYRALGTEQAMKIKAEADREKSQIISTAYKQAEITKGEGEAKAAKIYADAYSKAPEFFKFLRTLDAYKKILKEKTTIVMSSDSDLLKYLNEKTESPAKSGEKP